MPKFTTEDDVPVTGPDVFDPDDKVDKLETAEELLEAEVNDGNEFEETTALHVQAAAAYASFQLFTGAEHPEDAYSGQFQGGAGEDQAEVARECRQMYKDARDAILSSEADDSDDSSEFVFSA
jgi:hypothetical protein